MLPVLDSARGDSPPPPPERASTRSGDRPPTAARPHPRVSIGIPVYNGEAYLEQALRSVAAQTWKDYELVISDNASTDRSADICRAWASRDSRIAYHRNAVNIGGDRNHNRCFELSSGEYFLGLAHDDRLEPTYVETAVGVLDAEPDVVFCHSRTRLIDEAGTATGLQAPHAFSDSPLPHVRLRDAICDAQSIVVGFGMLRASVLRQTPLFKPYPSSDAFLQADLALRGRLYEIPEVLFLRRIHAGTGHAIPLHERLAWSDPSGRAAFTFPTWRRLGEYFLAIAKAPLDPRERLRCIRVVGEYVRRRRVLPQLVRDLRMAARQTVLRSPLGRRWRKGPGERP